MPKTVPEMLWPTSYMCAEWQQAFYSLPGFSRSLCWKSLNSLHVLPWAHGVHLYRDLVSHSSHHHPHHILFFFWLRLVSWTGIEHQALALEAPGPHHWTTREFPWPHSLMQLLSQLSVKPSLFFPIPQPCCLLLTPWCYLGPVTTSVKQMREFCFIPCWSSLSLYMVPYT